MANPAQLLFAQLSAWHVIDQRRTTAQVRHVHGSNVGWEQMRMAVRHLDAIEELLTQMSQAGRDVSVYHRHFPSWTTAVFAYPNGWNKMGLCDVNQQMLDHLHTLGDLMEILVPTLSPTGDGELRSFCARLLNTLDDDPTIPDPLKLHLREVVRHLEWCLDQYAVAGDFEVRKAVERLVAAMAQVAGASENPDRWKTVLNTWVWPFAVNMVSAIPAQTIIQLALGG